MSSNKKRRELNRAAETHRRAKFEADVAAYKRNFIDAVDLRLAAELDNAREQIATLTAQLADLRRDAERLALLARMHVTVRVPMAYGSREGFAGSPEEGETQWNIRAAIDAMLAEGGAK